MKLRGKGFFIWQLQNCEGGSAKAIAAKAQQAGLTHVLIKIADGADWPYNIDRARGVDLVPPVLTALKSAGIQVWGWHYVRGENPLGEARLGANRARSLGVDGYVIDAEREYKRSGKKVAAQRYAQELRRLLGDMPIALSSYRYPRVHYELPYAEFLAVCDYAMPQVYFEQSHDPEVQLRVSLDQYMSLPNARPVVPTFPTYSAGGWRPTPDEIRTALSTAKNLGLDSANAWSWDYASRSAYQDLWQAVAGFAWDPPPEPPPDVPEELIQRLNKRKISSITDLYHEGAAHVTGDRTVVGHSALKAWYRYLLEEALPDAKFELTGKTGAGTFRQFTWFAKTTAGRVVVGSDTLGILDGKIQYHYTHYGTPG
ncbi:MAG: nuclear transport factor 2 family protein [Anaerolineales bacterium]|nr:nuclear transport factor 2 family protein [Anaerolineales bacterium]